MSQAPNRRAFSTTILPRIILAVVVIIVVVVTVFRNGREADNSVVATPMQDPVVADTTPSTANVSSRPRFARAQPLLDTTRTARNEQRAAMQEQVDGTHAALASQYRNQKVDPVWAPGKERELAGLSSSDQIKQLNADVTNMTVDCKASVCKISGDFKSTTAGDDWVTLYMGNLGSKLPSASYKYIRNADGTVRIEIYGVGRK